MIPLPNNVCNYNPIARNVDHVVIQKTSPSIENSNPCKQSVVTVSKVALSESEMSVLSKGLNFIPVSKQSDEFQAKKDAENFFRRAQLKPFFRNSSDVTSNRDIFQRLNPSKSSWISPEEQFAFLDLSIDNKCLAMTWPTSILIVNLVFLISPKKNGQLSAIFAAVMILSLSLLTKVAPSLFGALIFTERRLIANYLIVPFIIR